jgi:O-antigen ligase
MAAQPPRSRPSAAGDEAAPTSSFERLLLLLLVVYAPNHSHLFVDLGVRGLNPFNLLLLLSLLTWWRAPRPAAAARGTAPVVAWVLMVTLSLLVSYARGTPHGAEDFVAWKETVSYTLLFFVTYRIARDAATIRSFVVAIAVVTLLVAIELYREAGENPLVTTKRYAGPFGNPNAAGAFLGIFVPMFLAFALHARARARSRALVLLAFLAGLSSVFFTQSRQAFINIAATTTLLGATRNLLAAALAVLMIANYSLWVPDNVINRIAVTTSGSPTGEGEFDSSSETRLMLWDHALRLSARNPLGIGLNRLQDEMQSERENVTDTHNGFLRALVEMGIQGLLSMLVLVLAMLALGIRLVRVARTDEARWFGHAFIAATVGVVFSNLLSSNFYQGAVMANYWVMAALAARAVMLSEAMPGQAATGRASPFARPRGGTAHGPAPLTPASDFSVRASEAMLVALVAGSLFVIKRLTT